ncbi:MAG: hypothetical protein LAO78_25640 [Acidobacteriia bacterium]|nr:hypothetical protein [Terriglobia bacterium]
MKSKSLLFLLALMATVALAQNQGKGQGPMSRYDPSTEATITGTIEEIQTLDTMCHSGTHLTVKTDKGNTEVALGPTKFLADQKFELKKGDQVQIVGAKANTRRGEMFMARQITSGGKTVTLRDDKGMPSWPRGMCR